MARYNGIYTDGFVFKNSKEKIEFTSGSKFYDDHLAISLSIDATDARLAIAGDVSSDATGIDASANKADITVRKSGSVEAYTSIQLHGADQSLSNHGTIAAQTYGIITTGDGSRVLNEGSINAGIGMSAFTAEDAELVNGRHGEIDADQAGILLVGQANMITRFVNRGSITAEEHGVLGGAANDVVVNRGKIVGDIDLGQGSDIFDGTHGTVKGFITGNFGDDWYYIDSKRLEIMEDQDRGDDSVVASIDYRLPLNFESLFLMGRKDIAAHGNGGDNSVYGNAGDNKLFGHEGINILSGEEGNDHLIGGSQQDTFVFASGFGHDTIKNFQDGIDRINTTYWYEFEDNADMLDHARNVDGDVVISHGKDRLIIENFSKSQLDWSDFTS